MAVRQPPYLLRIQARNFRSLRDINVRLGPLNVLVGPNGAGKTNLLEVIAFLGDSARRDLGPAVTDRGGFSRLLFRGVRKQPWVELEVEAAVTKNSNRSTTDVYQLSFTAVRRRRGSTRPDYLMREESFVFKRTSGPGRRITLKGADLVVAKGEEKERTEVLREGSLALNTLPKLGDREGGDQVEAVANLFESLRVFDVDVKAARQPSLRHVEDRLENDGANLGAYLQYLAAGHPQRFEDLESDAKHFIPGLERISFRSAGGAAEAVVTELYEAGLRDATDLSEASYGSVRALALLALLYDPSPERITCIEEIDHGLHPYVLDRLVELLRMASKRTQLLIATHSPALVNRLHAHELIVCEREADGSSRIPAIDPSVVRDMEAEVEGELSLGELWFSGALGGVPDA